MDVVEFPRANLQIKYLLNIFVNYYHVNIFQ